MAFTAYLDDVRGMATASPFGVKSVDCSALHSRNGVFHKAAFIQRIGMNHHLNIHRIRHAETIINCCWRCAPILMQFQCRCPSRNLFF